MDEQTDEQLMKAYQLGDESAFSELYRRHSSKVYSYVRKRVWDEASARDVYQQIFLKLHGSRSKYNGSYLFLPWLFTLSRNVMIDYFRTNGRNKETPVEVIPETMAEELTNEAPLVTDEGLMELPVNQREALELRFGRDLSFEEIGRQIGTSPSNARQLVSRAVRFLRGFYGRI